MNIEHKAKRSPAPTEQALHTQTIISHSINHLNSTHLSDCKKKAEILQD